MQTNNPLYRFFIEKLLSNQSDSELAIPFAVIITERQADKMTEKDFADILSSLIKFKRTNFLINFIIKHENLIINEHISLLIITALDEKQIDIATFLIEFVIRFNIELDKESFTHLFEKLLNTYNYSLLVLIFNAQLISKYKIDLHDHTHLIKTIEGYWFLRQYGFHLNLIDFINTPKKIISISDYLLNELLTTKYQQERTSFIDYIKNNEHRVTEFIIRLLVLDKEKTLFQWASLFSKKKLKKNPELHGILSFKKKLEDILLNSYTKKCFIRSRAMFIFLSTILPEKIDSTYLSKYLINLCEFPPGYNPTNDIRGLYHLRDTNTGQRKYNDSLDEFAANTAEPLHLLEHEFASELDEFSEDIKLNLRNIKVQDIGSYLPFLALSAARNKCYQLLVLFFEFHINFIPDDILLDIFNHLIAKKEYGLINDLFNYLPEDSGIQLTLFEEFIDGVDCQFLDKILANNQDYLLENQEILFRSTHVNFPHVAKKLMKLGIVYDDEKLKRLIHLAWMRQDNYLATFFEKKLSGYQPRQPEKISIGFFGQLTKTSNPSLKRDEQLLEEFYGVNITQKQYRQYCNDIAALVCLALQEDNFFLTFDTEKKQSAGTRIDLKYLGKLRGYIAKISGSEKFANFGQPRTSTLVTPHVDEYAPYFLEFISRISEHISVPTFEIKNYLFKRGEIGVDAQIYGNLNGERIPLTAFDVQKNQSRPHAKRQSYWKHTNPIYIEPILNYVQCLINESKVKDIVQSTIEPSIDILLEKMARIHWWLAHATPFKRGSASIAEIIIKGIMQFHGFKIKWNCLPDCKALIEPDVEKYVKQYKDFCIVKRVPSLQKNRPDLTLALLEKSRLTLAN